MKKKLLVCLMVVAMIFGALALSSCSIGEVVDKIDSVRNDIESIGENLPWKNSEIDEPLSNSEKETYESTTHSHYFERIPSERCLKTPASCTQKAEYYYSCGCGELDYNTFEYGDYEHQEVIDKAVNPTCTKTGLTEGKHCSECNKILTAQTEVPALGHNFVNGTCSRCNVKSNLNYTKDGNYIYFGSYPQTLITDNLILSHLNTMAGTLPTSTNNYAWTDYKYYQNGSIQKYMWYIDKEYNNVKYRGIYFTSYRPYNCNAKSSPDSSYIYDHNFNLRSVYWFKYEPIKWRILSEENGQAFLMSDIAIDAQQYYHSASETRTVDGRIIYPNNYAESEIRKWLNETFYNTAFSDLQKNIVITTSVDNSTKSTGSNDNRYACENTNDKVFLLSINEITDSKYVLNSLTARRLESSDYAKSQGCRQETSGSNKGNCLWWLRSPSNGYSSDARYVKFEGDHVGYSLNVSYTSSGVVPALRIIL